MVEYCLGEIAEKLVQRATRTKAPVRRGSREKGTFEEGWYRPPTADQYGLMCDGVRLVDEHIKRASPGARSGPFGLAGDKIMRVMQAAIDKISGRLDVSWDWLCLKTGCSRPTVAKALVALEEYGFIERQRRCVRREVEDGDAGPRWKQATNVYRLALPPLARRLLGQRGRPAPTPDDERERHENQMTQAAEMVETIPPDELGSHVTEDLELAAALNRLGSHFTKLRTECELNQLTEPYPTNSIRPQAARERRETVDNCLEIPDCSPEDVRYEFG